MTQESPVESLNTLRSVLAGQDMTFLAGVPYVYHCHHYNLFHDQTIDDALGEQLGAEVRFAAARAATGELLAALSAATGADTPAERIALASRILPWMGHGRLELAATATGGEATGSFLHYAFTWREKYGSRVKRDEPADAFAGGFAAAAVENAFRLPPGSIDAVEDQCLALRDGGCHFRLQAATPSPPLVRVDEEAVALRIGATLEGLDEARVAAIADGLRGFLRGVAGDDRGVIAAFGVFVTMHLSNYYNQTVFEAIHHIERTSPGAVPAGEALLREAGQVCVFNTFGNLLLSPEWEGMVGSPTGDPLELLTYSCAIARGLGFGHWSVHEFEPGRRLVLRAPADYESPFYLARYGQSPKPRCYFLQGSALAMMVMAHSVPWSSRPELTPELYQSLFRGKLPWVMEQTRCPTRGDALSEIVVTAR
jgi:hypothetical protein